MLSDLAEVVIPNGLRNGHPGFAGWVTTAPTTSSTTAHLAAAVAGAQRWWVQAFNDLEEISLRWLAELLDIPPTWQGTYCSGGSVANLIGLAAARQHAFERHGIDPAADGLPPANWRVYAGSEVHHVVNRAAAVLGLGRRSVTTLPVDRAQRMDLAALENALSRDAAEGTIPVAIVATAGTVNTGAVDPISDIVEIARRYGTWVHVDGAYGLFGRLDPEVAPLFDGLENADSAAVDPHKWLAAPLGCGATFVRDRGVLGRALTLEPAEYLEGSTPPGQLESPFDDLGFTYHDFNVAQSAPSRGAAVWAILSEIGSAGMRDRVVRHNGFARRVAALAHADPHLEVLAPPTLSICCFRHTAPGTETDLDSLNEEIARRLRSEGDVVPSTTRVGGSVAIRPCFINPRTRQYDVDLLVRRVREIGDELAPGEDS